MVDMGMRQENEHRPIFFSPAICDNPGKVFSLPGETARIDQKNDI
jgi:hypothetical protein